MLVKQTYRTNGSLIPNKASIGFRSKQFDMSLRTLEGSLPLLVVVGTASPSTSKWHAICREISSRTKSGLIIRELGLSKDPETRIVR